MFWTDVHLQLVVRARLDGSERTVLVDEGLTTPGKPLKFITSITLIVAHFSTFSVMHAHAQVQKLEPTVYNGQLA